MTGIVFALGMLLLGNDGCDTSIHVPSWALDSDWYVIGAYPITGDFIGLLDLNILPSLRSVEGHEWTAVQLGHVNTNCHLRALVRVGLGNLARGDSWVGVEAGFINHSSDSSNHHVGLRVGFINFGPSTTLIDAALFNMHTRGRRTFLMEVGFGNAGDDESETVGLLQLGHLNWQNGGRSAVLFQVSPLIPAAVAALVHFWATEAGGVDPRVVAAMAAVGDLITVPGAMILTSVGKPAQQLGVVGANFVYGRNDGVLQLATVNVSGAYSHLLQAGFLNVGANRKGLGGDGDSVLVQAALCTNIAHSLGTTIQLGSTNFIYGGGFGAQLGGFVNVMAEQDFSEGRSMGFSGLQAGLINYADESLRGAQIGGINVMNGTLRGVQVGLINYAKELRGVQIGGLNLAGSGALYPVLPLINAGW